MPANAITTYDSPQGTGANREDLEDIAYDISPERTPVLTMAKKLKAKGISHDWLTDALATPSATGVAEGKVTTAVSPDAPTRLRNVTQINERPVFITESQQAVESAGDWGKADRETARRMAELKRDVETRLLSMNPLVVGDEGTPVARQTRSPMHFIRDVASGGTGVGYTDSASETAAVGSFIALAALDEVALDTAMKAAFDVGGMPSKFVVSSTNKVVVSSFTGRVNEVLNTSETKVTRDVQAIQTPHGRVEVIIDQFYPAGAAKDDFSFIVDPEYLGVAWLRKMGRVKLAKTGDFESWLTNCEWAAVVMNPNAHAVIGYDAVP
jgi:hypothetical protein